MNVVLDTAIQSFPLERPLLRGRYRESIVDALSLPYFITGAENRLANFVCQSDTSVFQMGNPILLIGPGGSGKTAIALHLAASESIRQNKSDDSAAVRYLPAVDFARGYAEAVDADDLPPFQVDIDGVPILIIDDLQLINDKPAAQDELAARIESRSQRSMPTILTCRRLPSEIRGMRPALVSRALPGLTVPICPPVDEARTLVLSELAAKHSVELLPESLAELDSALPEKSAVRSLEAAIKQLDLWCRMNESGVTNNAIKSAIESSHQTDHLEISNIAKAVAKFVGLRTADLRSKSRKQSVVRARSLAMLISRRLTSKSLNQIGEYFGGRDHSTVLHAIRKTESSLETDTDLSQVMRDVTEKLNC